MKNKMFIKNMLIVVLSVASFIGVTGNVYAEQYGETEVNKSFRITKEVKIKDGDKGFRDKVKGAEKDDIIVFRIEVENTGDLDVDDMKYEDFLPDEMKRVGGSGLTEYWDDFDSGDKVKFEIEAIINDEEFDRENFEKCIVNKVELSRDDDFEGSDTATVCYSDGEVEELPQTGVLSTAVFGLVGTSLVIGSFALKKRE